MIYLITDRLDQYSQETQDAIKLRDDIEISTGNAFSKWYNSVKTTDQFTQFDTETNVVNQLYFRELYVAQIGSQDGLIQWLFDIPQLSKENETALTNYLVDSTIYKICHYSMFEFTIIKWKYNIRIKKVRDTFLMAKILTTGIDTEADYLSLAGCLERFLGIHLDKLAQTSYTGEPLNLQQIDYAATDVLLLVKLHMAVQEEIDHWGLENVVRLECAVLRPLGDGMTWNWFLNIEEWQVNIDFQRQEVNELTTTLHQMIHKYLKSECSLLGFIQKEDEYHFNWSGKTIKNQILKLIYPNIPNSYTTIREYKEYLKLLQEGLHNEDPKYLEFLLNKDYETLQNELIKNYNKELKELQLFTAKDTVLINFNSTKQKLEFFRLIDPTLLSTNKKALSKIDHLIVEAYKKLSHAQKLLTSYGTNYIDAVNPDGMLRIPDITQILETGRTSMKLYQLLPGRDMYRTPFYLKDDWVGVGADYNSQELCVMATFADDKIMLQAIKDGKDLHSVGAAALFPEKWIAAGEDPNCFGKPKTEEGLDIRKKIKELNFGIPYGKSVVGLASDLNILIGISEIILAFPEESSKYIKDNLNEYLDYCKIYHENKNNASTEKSFLKEQHILNFFKPEIVTSDDLVRKYFETFPGIYTFLEGSGEFAQNNCYIATPDIFQRIRFFAPPADKSEVAAIRRAGQNFPIQSSSANITKYAAVLIDKYLDDHELNDTVRFLAFLHDELWYGARKHFAKEWREIQVSLMEEAASFVLGHDLLKVESQIYWDQKWHK